MEFIKFIFSGFWIWIGFVILLFGIGNLLFSFYNRFTTNNINDVRNCYEKLGEEFCRHYYSIFDQNFPEVGRMYTNNPRITFHTDRFSNFDELYRCRANA